MSNENNVLTIKTIQIAPFRILITALKDFLVDSNISLKPDGIRIIDMDKTQRVVVNLFLPAENFEFYECKKEKILIGVNMGILFKFISQVENDDTLTIYIDNAHYSEGVVSHLSFKFENGIIKQCRKYHMKLIDVDQDEIDIPEVTFSSIINMPSQDFQKLVKNLELFSDKVEINSVGNELILKASGSIGDCEIHRSESDDSLEYILKQDPSKIIQGVFSLKHLCYFIKCTNLCNSIEINFENDLPLVVKYSVASLGKITFGLVPL